MKLRYQAVWARYAIAVFSIATAVGLTLVIRTWFTLNPTPLILIGVIAAAWFGGKYPGLLACLVADLCIDYFFEDPLYTLNPLAPVHLVRLLILCTVSLLVSSRRQAEDVLRVRAGQSAAVAQFGQDAISTLSVEQLLSRGTDVIIKTLGVELAAICEATADKSKLCYATGTGWSEEIAEKDFDFSTETPLIKHVFENGEPLLINDLQRDARFGPSSVLNRSGIRSGIIITIRQPEKIYGILGVFQRKRRTFSADDINFMQSMANIIAEATERRAAENAINEQRVWLRTTLSSIGDGVIATDSEGRVIFMNSIAEDLTGWQEESAAGLHLQQVFRIINEETGSEAEDPVAKVFSTGLVVGLANHTVLISKDGREIPIDDSAAPITDGGDIRGVVLVFSDVSEKRGAEAARRESEIMRRLVEAQESERHRIARDLHDHLGQHMTALRLQIEGLAEKTTGNQDLNHAIEMFRGGLFRSIVILDFSHGNCGRPNSTNLASRMQSAALSGSGQTSTGSRPIFIRPHQKRTIKTGAFPRRPKQTFIESYRKDLTTS